jgi:hypothetical protein
MFRYNISIFDLEIQAKVVNEISFLREYLIALKASGPISLGISKRQRIFMV